MKKLLLNIWRQRDLHFHDSTLFHLQTCWTSSLKGIVPERYIYVDFPFIVVLVFIQCHFFSSVSVIQNVMTLLQVIVHLSKLFDSMSDLEFAKNKQLDNPKLAVGMYSKEREYVPFQTECSCYGPVRFH